MDLHYATLWEAIADAIGDREAVVTGPLRRTWSEYEDRASRLAAAFAGAGLGRDSKIGLYLWNSNEYLEAQFAGMKLRGVPVNINYRYLDDELLYLLDNSDAEALVFHTSLGDRVERVRERAPRVKIWIEVDDGGPSLPGALAYEELIAGHDPAPRISRSPDDTYMLYTGGTTGMPKGVMWRHEDLFFTGLQGGSPGGDPVESPEQLVEQAKEGWYTVTMLPCAPFIHGAAQWTQWICHLTGGKLVLQNGPSFDAKRILSLVAEEDVSTMSLVGDAMAIPLVEELKNGDYDMSNLAVIASAGAILSGSVQAEIEELLPDVMVINSFGTSESGDLGRAAGDEDSHEGRPSFYMGDEVTVLDENGDPIEPGSGQIGLVARSGRLPLGYYKDPDKTAERFKEFKGKRWVVPGDFATVEADGRITFLGRGSKCINTGGEKVFPEEVEEALKAHPDIIDALVVAVPDPRFGSKVAAVFNTRGDKQLSLDEVQAHCRDHVAGYKIPRQITITETVSRMPSGKPDYKWAEEIAREQATAHA